MSLRIATIILFYVAKNWSCFAYIVPLQLKEERYIRRAKWYQHLGSTVQMGIFVWRWVSSHLHLSLQARILLNLRHCRIETFHHIGRINSWKLSAPSTSTSGQTSRVTLRKAASGGTQRGLQRVEIVSFHLFVLSFSGKRCLSHSGWWWNAGLNAKKTLPSLLEKLHVQTTLPFCFCPSWSCLSSSLSWISFSSSLQSAFTSCSWFERPKVSGFAWLERKYEGLLQGYACSSVVPTTPQQYVHLPVCVHGKMADQNIAYHIMQKVAHCSALTPGTD